MPSLDFFGYDWVRFRLGVDHAELDQILQPPLPKYVRALIVHSMVVIDVLPWRLEWPVWSGKRKISEERRIVLFLVPVFEILRQFVAVEVGRIEIFW